MVTAFRRNPALGIAIVGQFQDAYDSLPRLDAVRGPPAVHNVLVRYDT